MIVVQIAVADDGSVSVGAEGQEMQQVGSVDEALQLAKGMLGGQPEQQMAEEQMAEGFGGQQAPSLPARRMGGMAA